MGDPRSEIASSSNGEPVYVLSEDECLWSAWLNIALNCEQHEPWLMEHICAARDRQIIAEKSSNIAWYGNDEQEFQRFLRQLTYEK